MRQQSSRARGRKDGGWPRRLIGDRGDGVIEFVLLAGPLLLVTFVVIQFAITFYARSSAQAAATAAVNVARQRGVGTPAVEKAAKDFLAKLPAFSTGSTVVVKIDGDVATVTVSVVTTNLLWLPLPDSVLTVTEEAQRPVERFVP